MPRSDDLPAWWGKMLVGLLLVASGIGLGCQDRGESTPAARRAALADSMHPSLTHLIDTWYPRAVDSMHDGFFSTFDHRWEPTGPQDKMIVTQARHVWTASRVAEFGIQPDRMTAIAAHGVQFLRNEMWDESNGGFHSLVTQEGTEASGDDGFTDVKSVYGNAFAIYGLAAYHDVMGDSLALALAQRTFRWLDEHAYDREHGGYFRALRDDGTPYVDGYGEYPSKGQNTSIHLLEAFTALYGVWPDSTLRARLREMRTIVRDTMVTDRGYLRLFYQADWTPISYHDSAETVRRENYSFDHVSFGHDVETAVLLLEAEAALGGVTDTTRTVAKRMVDHALDKGWDDENGGFYDGGYYSTKDGPIEIVRDTKTWWSQAEGLQSLALMARLYPDANRDYLGRLEAQWNYCTRFLIDDEHGGWYGSGLDQSPDHRTAEKATIWKGNYHTVRALVNTIRRLRAESEHALL